MGASVNRQFEICNPKSQTLGNAQFGAARSRIISYLSLRRLDRLAADTVQRRPMLARADGLLWGAETIARFGANKVLDDPVFERVKRDDGEPSARLEQRNALRQRCRKHVQFFIDADTQGLES